MGKDTKYVWVFTADQAVKDEVLDKITKAFSTEENAKAYMHDFVHSKDGEYQFAQKHGWEIAVDNPDHFMAYEEGYYNSNHTEAEVIMLKVE